MRPARLLASWRQRCRRAALLAVVITVTAPVFIAAAAGPPGFDGIPEPSWTPAIRAPEEIVPRAEHPAAASWRCLEGGDPVAPVNELERLIRLSVVLEAARSPRAELLAARDAAIEAGEPLLIAIAEAFEADLAQDSAFAGERRRPDWLPTVLDPLSPVLGGPERDAWNRWAVLLPPDGGCGDDTATITDRAVAVAMLIRQRDGSFLSVRGTLAAIAREGRAIAGRVAPDDTPGARGRRAGRCARVFAMLSLDAAESAWAESSTLIAELVDSAATSRGLAAAARALSLQTTSQYLAQSDDPAGRGRGAPGLALGRHRARPPRRDSNPALIVEQPTVLDLEFTPDDSPRRAAVAALIASLEGQLPMLEQLYDARASREAAFPAASNAEADLLREAFGQRADGLWSRLAHAARQLGERDLEEWRHAWAWTEIGTIRDRLLPLEAALSQIEQDALWTATGDVTAFDDAVDRQWLLMAAIEDARTSEAGHTAELQRSAEN